MFLLLAFNVALLGVSCCCCAGSNQAKVDAYADAIIGDANRQIIDAKLDRFPLKAFEYKISKTAISNRDVKVNVTRGHFEGLKNISRRKACKATLPAPVKGRTDLAPPSNITISCNVTLAGVKAMILNATFRGETLSASSKNFSTVSTIESAEMNVTFVGRPGLKGHLTLTGLDKIVLSTTFMNAKEKPDLNKERFMNFTDGLNNKLAAQLFAFAEGPYRAHLASAVNRKILPYLV